MFAINHIDGQGVENAELIDCIAEFTRERKEVIDRKRFLI
jgi:hypothetical protein